MLTQQEINEMKARCEAIILSVKALEDENERLQVENLKKDEEIAALKARVEKSVELPCNVENPVENVEKLKGKQI